MKPPPFRTYALLGLAVLFGSCDDPAAPLPSGVVSVTIDSSAGPLVRVATITLERPAPVEVTYGAPGTPVLSIVADSQSAVYKIVLPRLRAGSNYKLEVGIPEDRGVHQAAFGTGALPAALAAIELTVTGAPTEPVSLIEIASAGAAGGGFTGLLMVEESKIVGYIPIENSLFGMTRRANGHIVVLHSERGLLSYRLDGSLAHQLAQSPPGVLHRRIHHDVIATPSNTLLFIANDTSTIDGVYVIGEALWEWNPEAGSVVKRWSAFDHLNWRTERGREGGRSVPGNWLHGNGIQYGPRGNVVMSLRNISQVISISPDFSTVEWKLGGAQPTLALPDADRFFGQHYVSEPTQNRILIFDNGFSRPGCFTHTDAACYSRAVEYSINTAAKTATPVWEYRPSPKIYASLVGSARRLANGNSVVLFGMKAEENSSSGPRVAFEVTEAGVQRWSLKVDSENPSRVYRLTTVKTLLGEQPGAFKGN